MTLERTARSEHIVVEHLLSDEQLYREMREIERLVDARFGLRGTPKATLGIDPDTNVTLNKAGFVGPVKPPRKISNITGIDGRRSLKSEQVAHIGKHGRMKFTPLVVFEDPSLGHHYVNSQEAVTEIYKMLAHLLSYPHE